VSRPVQRQGRSKTDARSNQLWKTFAAVDLDDRLHTTLHLVTKVASAVGVAGGISTRGSGNGAVGRNVLQQRLYGLRCTRAAASSSIDTSAMDRVAASTVRPTSVRRREIGGWPFHLVHGSVDPLIGEEGSAPHCYVISRAAASGLDGRRSTRSQHPANRNIAREMLDFTPQRFPGDSSTSDDRKTTLLRASLPVRTMDTTWSC